MFPESPNMSMATDRVGAQPRNLDYYLSRMSGYSKNTIRIQPQSKERYNAGDTIIFRLPTNSILDLHTLTLRYAGQILNINAATTGEVKVAWPRYSQSVIRRLDVTMGGMQAGLGSLHDYGFLYNLLSNHKTPLQRSDVDLAVTDGTKAISTLYQGGATGGTDTSNGSEAGSYSIANNATGTASSGWKPFTVSSWLGIASGTFMVR